MACDQWDRWAARYTEPHGDTQTSRCLHTTLPTFSTKGNCHPQAGPALEPACTAPPSESAAGSSSSSSFPLINPSSSRMWELHGTLPGKTTGCLGFPRGAGVRGPGHPWPEGTVSVSNLRRGRATGKLPRDDPRCTPHKAKTKNQGLRLGSIPRCPGPGDIQEELLAPTMTTSNTPYSLNPLPLPNSCRGCLDISHREGKKGQAT